MDLFRKQVFSYNNNNQHNNNSHNENQHNDIWHVFIALLSVIRLTVVALSLHLVTNGNFYVDTLNMFETLTLCSQCVQCLAIFWQANDVKLCIFTAHKNAQKNFSKFKLYFPTRRIIIRFFGESVIM